MAGPSTVTSTSILSTAGTATTTTVEPPITRNTSNHNNNCDSSYDSSNSQIDHHHEEECMKNVIPDVIQHVNTIQPSASNDEIVALDAEDTDDDDVLVNHNNINMAVPGDMNRIERDVATPSPPYEDNHHHTSATPTATTKHVPMIHNWDGSDDESGNIMERDYTGMFEGPEKTLEVVFRRVDDDHTTATTTNNSGINNMVITNNNNISNNTLSDSTDDLLSSSNKIGLRQLSRHDIDRICHRARCTILSSISNRYLDAYVLSESSLFIYPYMLVLKTCGTTTLLRCIATLIDLGRKLGLEIDWVGYSRKNFNFPGDQAFPHQSFHQELDYLYSHRILSERLDGNGYTLGPVNGDHWFVFVADHTCRTGALDIDTDRVLNIMMFDIDENIAKFFYYNEYDQIPNESKEDEIIRISHEQTIESGIKDLCPGAIIDPRAFEPCGYSMNAILFRSYTTIHITPESGSSYASFETNQKVSSYKALISNVIRTFRPKRFVMTLLADEGGIKQVKDNPLTDAAIDSKIVVPATKAPESGSALRLASYTKQSLIYKRSSLASIKVEEDCCCMMGNWVLEKSMSTTSGISTSTLTTTTTSPTSTTTTTSNRSGQPIMENCRSHKSRGMTFS